MPKQYYGSSDITEENVHQYTLLLMKQNPCENCGYDGAEAGVNETCPKCGKKESLKRKLARLQVTEI